MTFEWLPEFRGIAVEYDQDRNPFFKAIVLENLRKIDSVAPGRVLLNEIANAVPWFRGDFPLGVNVKIVPWPLSFTQSGHRLTPEIRLDGSTVTRMTAVPPGHQAHVSGLGLPFWISEGSHNESMHQEYRHNGWGSVCTLRYGNAQTITNTGEKNIPPFIVLAHELIHALHCLKGIAERNGANEENWTRGVGSFADSALTENTFRGAFRLARRTDIKSSTDRNPRSAYCFSSFF